MTTKCTIKHCDKDARWTVTVEGHPNARGTYTNWYCAEHADRAYVWDEAPTVYTITIRGPFNT